MHSRVAEYPTRTQPPSRSVSESLGNLQLPDAKKAFAAAEELILKYPGAALATAALAGVFVAWWIKRK